MTRCYCQWGSRWYRQVPKSFTLSFEWVVVFKCLSRDKFMNVLPWVWYLYISIFMLIALNTIIKSLPMPTVPFHFENFREVHHSRITPGSVCKYYSDVERWEVQTVLGSCNDYRSAWDKRPLKMLFSTKKTFFWTAWQPYKLVHIQALGINLCYLPKDRPWFPVQNT